MLIADAVTDIVGKIDWPKSSLPTTIPEIATTVLHWLLGFAGGFAVLALIYSGILYIISTGDSSKAETAKKNFTWAIIGVVLITLAYFIVSVVQDVLSNAAPQGAVIQQTQVQPNQTARNNALQSLQTIVQQMTGSSNSTTQQQVAEIQGIIQGIQNDTLTPEAAAIQIQGIVRQMTKSNDPQAKAMASAVLAAGQALGQSGSASESTNSSANSAAATQIQNVIQQLQNNPTPQQAAALGTKLQAAGYSLVALGQNDLGQKLLKIGLQLQAGANIAAAIQDLIALSNQLQQSNQNNTTDTSGGGDPYTGDYTPPTFEEPATTNGETTEGTRIDINSGFSESGY